MTDTDKLNALIAHIQSAEKYAFEKETYDNEWARTERCNGIQDITCFIENVLGIEIDQLPIDKEKASKRIPNKYLDGIREVAREIGDVPSAYLEGLNDACMICSGYTVDEVLEFRRERKSW